MPKVITRYAPSPTGNPHVGNIRTALFAYLHAKSKNGDYLLRIEDTDRARFVPEAVGYIEDSLNWLGIKWDGEKVFQSDKLPLYQKYANELIEKGHAYKCFCTSERLEELREEQTKNKQAPKYDRLCAKLTEAEIKTKVEAGEKFVVRFKMPNCGSAKWNDMVRGEIEIEYATQDDPIILKSDGWPTYHLANIIDDHEMNITDVVRGEEWIPSTPKHIALYEAFGWEKPKFGHLPVILGADKSKLSKRHGDTAILDYREKGYLPEAIINFLALLGWNPGTTEEVFDLSDLIKEFGLNRVQKAPAVFDIERLNWLNGMYIRKLSVSELTDKLVDFDPELKKVDREFLEKIVTVEQSRLKTLADFKEVSAMYFELPKYNKDIIVFKKSTPEVTKKGLSAATETLAGLDWDNKKVEDFEKMLLDVVAKEGLTNGDVFWPVRVALSGSEKSASPAELLWALGKGESISRLNFALKNL